MLLAQLLAELRFFQAPTTFLPPELVLFNTPSVLYLADIAHQSQRIQRCFVHQQKALSCCVWTFFIVVRQNRRHFRQAFMKRPLQSLSCAFHKILPTATSFRLRRRESRNANLFLSSTATTNRPTIYPKGIKRPRPIDPKPTWAVDKLVSPHIRACLPKIQCETEELGQRNTGMSVCTLGTGSGSATAFRAQAATVIRMFGVAYLIDAGEGVQKQIINSRISIRDIKKIFITHMHADHIFGLPGLLLHLQVTAGVHDEQQKQTLDIYGPMGLYNYIVTSLTFSGSEMRKLKVNVYEFHGGTQRSMRQPCNRQHFSEFQQQGVFRRMIPQNEDGTFTLMEPLEITTRESARRLHSEPEGLSIKAAEIHHVPQLQCFGYTFEEPYTMARKLYIDEAKQLGVFTTDKYRELKSGFPVRADDDHKREVHPQQVCDEAPRPRKITVLGDTCLVPRAMEKLATNSDILVHEATLSMLHKGKKVEEGGHSTAADAGIVASKVHAKVLLLTHLSVNVDKDSGMRSWIEAAQAKISGNTRVQLAFDYMEIMIPKGGFPFGGREVERFKAPHEITSSLSKLMGIE